MGRVYSLLALLMLIGIGWPSLASAHSGHGTDASASAAQVTAEWQAIDIGASQTAEIVAQAPDDCDDSCCDDGCCQTSGRCCSAAVDLSTGFAADTHFPSHGGFGQASNPRAGPPGPASDIDHPPAFA